MNKIYQKALECLGLDMSTKEDEYGCAEAVNKIFKLATGREVGGDISTYRMYLSLRKDDDFIQSPYNLPGDIIISPTGFGKGNGHVGIVSENNKIMSNNSANSLWEENYTIDEWRNKFKDFPILFYRYRTDEVKIIEQKKINILEAIVVAYQKIISLLLKK